jgi:hypothetical protein
MVPGTTRLENIEVRYRPPHTVSLLGEQHRTQACLPETTTAQEADTILQGQSPGKSEVRGRRHNSLLETRRVSPRKEHLT